MNFEPEKQKDFLKSSYVDVILSEFTRIKISRSIFEIGVKNQCILRNDFFLVCILIYIYSLEPVELIILISKPLNIENIFILQMQFC